MKEGTKIILILAVISIAAFLLYSKFEQMKSDLRKELQKEKEFLLKQDSVSDATFKRAIDSLTYFKTTLEDERIERRIENERHRQRNEASEKLYRSIDISSRPDY